MAKARGATSKEVTLPPQEAPATTGLTSDVKPSYLQQMEGRLIAPTDNFDQNDVVIPRIKLLQGLSKECEDFNEAKAGLFWHTGFDRVIGADFDFVVCSRRKRYLLVAPLDDGQGILARADDFVNWNTLGEWKVKLDKGRKIVDWSIGDLNVVQSGLDQWGTFDPDDPKSPPAATLFYDYLVVMPAFMDLGPAVLSLTRSQIRKARRGLNDKIQLHQGAGRPMQAIVFSARSVGDRNKNNQDFKNWHFTGNGFAEQTLYNRASDLKNAFGNYVVSDEEGAASEEAEIGTAKDTGEY